MAIRNNEMISTATDWSAGDYLIAQDLNDTFTKIIDILETYR
jgi:hypothetical protein